MRRRLNWGCGNHTAPGWINSDVRHLPGVDLQCNVLRGLPLSDDSLDAIVSVHALQEIPYLELVPALREMHRVLRPAGVLRLVLPDLERGFAAYQRGDREYFQVPDSDAESVGAKLVVQLVWYGYSRIVFTRDFIHEQLQRAGFRDISDCAFRQTASDCPDIVRLDNREAESLFVEARK